VAIRDRIQEIPGSAEFERTTGRNEVSWDFLAKD
jgi:hypothetical protein